MRMTLGHGRASGLPPSVENSKAATSVLRSAGDGERRSRRRRVIQASGLLGPVAAAVLFAVPAAAEDKVPNPVSQEILIKTSLLTLNDANITGNYAVLHAKLAKPFRDQFTPDRLREAFKKLV